MKIFEKVNVDAKTLLGVAGVVVAIANAVISNKQETLKKQELISESAEAAAKIVKDTLSNNED